MLVTRFIGVEASMVMQGTVNPPPLARLVRSQDTPPVLRIVSSIGRALHCHCRGKGIETPTVRHTRVALM